MTEEVKKEVLQLYQTSRHSIQTIARTFNISVEDVLEITDNKDISTVTFVGDLIDASDLTGTNATINTGATYKLNFTKD